MAAALQALALAYINTDAFDLRWPAVPAISDIRFKPETNSDERRRKLPSISPRRKIGPTPAIHFQNPFKPQHRSSAPPRAMTLIHPRLLERITTKPKGSRKPRPKRPQLLPPIPPLAKSNIMCYLATVGLPIPLFPKKSNGTRGYYQELNELRILLEVFGETGYWILEAEDVCCRYCVDRMRHQETHRLRRIRFTTRYLKNYFFKPNCRHQFVFPLKEDAGFDVKLKYDIALRRLTHHLGPSSTNRIQNIILRMETLDINILCSALDMITKTLLNLQRIIIFLPSTPPSPPLDYLATRRLWKSLHHLDKKIPSKNTVIILGLQNPGYERLERKWRGTKHSCWFRRKFSKVLEKTDRPLSERLRVWVSSAWKIRRHVIVGPSLDIER